MSELKYKPFRFGDVTTESRKRGNENSTRMRVYGVSYEEGLTATPKYQAINLTRYKAISPGMFAYNPMRLNIGSIGYCSNEHEDGLVSPDYVVFECKRKHLNPEFLRYYIHGPEWKQWTAEAGVGSVRVRIYYKELATMPLLLPPLKQQGAIVALLQAIDDKIDLNRRMNRTLEAMAQAIFTSWFVDFDPVRAKAEAKAAGAGPAATERAAMAAIAGKTEAELAQLPESQQQSLAQTAALFPDGFQSSEFGEIPVGWTSENLSEHATIEMGQSPKGETYNDQSIGTPLVNGPVEFGVYFTRRSKWTTSPTKLSKEGDLIVCVRGSTTGCFVKSDGEYCLGRGVCSMRGIRSQVFVDLLFKQSCSKLLELTTGSTFPNWSVNTLRNFKVIFPEHSIVEAFEQSVGPLLIMQETNERQSETLAQLRDTLLPKLLSGELAVPEAESFTEEASA